MVIYGVVIRPIYNLKLQPLVGVVWLNHFADYAFFYGVAALVLCYKSVKKVTFIGHPSVMTTVKNSPRIILMTK